MRPGAELPSDGDPTGGSEEVFCGGTGVLPANELRVPAWEVPRRGFGTGKFCGGIRRAPAPHGGRLIFERGGLIELDRLVFGPKTLAVCGSRVEWTDLSLGALRTLGDIDCSPVRGSIDSSSAVGGGADSARETEGRRRSGLPFGPNVGSVCNRHATRISEPIRIQRIVTDCRDIVIVLSNRSFNNGERSHEAEPGGGGGI